MKNDTKKETDITVNKKAFHDYFIDDRYEAGISLVGTEVKAIREGKANLRDSFARVEDDEVFLYRCNISPYSHGNIANHDPARKRRLLLHKGEIRKLIGKTEQKGFALIPIRIYLKKGRVKVELALAKGKKEYDKREDIKRKESQREIEKAFKNNR
ncbi:MAG: SsrA-binding protein SmpB [Nitrospirota bacterium]